MTVSPAIRLHAPGGPDQLRFETAEIGAPASGEILLRQSAIGVNFHDVYVRSGLYQTLALPGTPGIEGVGIVEAVGSAVNGLVPGDRIGYVAPEYGGYAAYKLLAAGQAIKLPSTIDDIGAAGSLMKTLTACMLLRRLHRVEVGDTILVHAAAGGVGQMLCRWASFLGATVIGTVGTAEKAQIAREAGARHTILYREEDFLARVLEITDGVGVSAVYDSVGEETFLKSLKSLGYGGKLLNFGQASGAVQPFSPALLAARSTSVCRPIIFHFLRTAGQIQSMMADVTDAFAQGALVPLPAATFPLSRAADAHRCLEGRSSPGAVVLLPEG